MENNHRPLGKTHEWPKVYLRILAGRGYRRCWEEMPGVPLARFTSAGTSSARRRRLEGACGGFGGGVALGAGAELKLYPPVDP
jgi:hypothetical protein